ncbi:MAG TPA: GNAT family N-acetyltransferase [Candidatus Dormibacteraeota bacterium]|nr:GNAT family N-acetyltransferase [Candidatus Dormibacteraeota bacterium]
MTDSPLIEVDPTGREWRALLGELPDATAFHHPGWASVLAGAYGYRPIVLAVEDGSGRLAAGAPLARVRRRGRPAWVSLPFSDHCPVLARDGGARRRLAEGLVAWGARAGAAVEVRGDVPSADGWREDEIGVRHVLALDAGADAIRAGMHATHRKRLRQAERSGLTVRLGRSADDVADFYRLQVATRRRQGVPVQPRRFFDAIWRHVLAAGLGIVALAGPPGGRPVAGAVLLAWNGTLTVKFQASDEGAWRLRPNHLLYWEVIRWAIGSGQRRLDFGRTEAAHATLQQWKDGWGAEAIPLTYARTGGPAPAAGGGRLAAAMAPVIRRSPSFVCRGLGALLYRYAA